MLKSYLKTRQFTQDSNVIVNVIIKTKGLWQSQVSQYFFGQVDILKIEMDMYNNPKVN